MVLKVCMEKGFVCKWRKVSFVNGLKRLSEKVCKLA